MGSLKRQSSAKISGVRAPVTKYWPSERSRARMAATSLGGRFVRLAPPTLCVRPSGAKGSAAAGDAIYADYANAVDMVLARTSRRVGLGRSAGHVAAPPAAARGACATTACCSAEHKPEKFIFQC